MVKKKLPMSGIISGVGQSVSQLFKSGTNTDVSSKNISKADQQPDVAYPSLNLPMEKRIVQLVYRYYREAQYERIPFARKWMRNLLFFMGYQELEWSDTQDAYEAIIREPEDYAFPNNYYRSHILKGAGMYVSVEPHFTPHPVSDDYESLAVAKASKTALEVIKENVDYDALRIEEAINLRIFGNSFRYQYYSTDPRYGTVQMPVYENQNIQLDNGYYQHPETGEINAGQPPEGLEVAPENITEPTSLNALVPKGIVNYPKGQEKSECVNPFQVYVRSSAHDLDLSPYIIRIRMVDTVVLKSAFPGKRIVGSSPEGSGDIGILFQQSIMDLPSDPTQFQNWYSRISAAPRAQFLQAWLDPVLYANADPALAKKFPNGLYAAVSGDTLLETKNENKRDHWVHFPYIKVPGRFYGDGDDDIIPKQMELNENERLIMRNIAFNSSPQTLADKMRIDTNKLENDPGEVIPVKSMGGKPVADAYEQVPGEPLPEEVYAWRNMILTDMEYHTNTFGSAIGEHQPGVDTLGGQQMFAERAVNNLSPMLLLFKKGNQEWARQLLKLAAENWIDERVHSVMGINGHWEFAKMKGAALNPDKVVLKARIMPADYNQQQSFSNAVAVGLLNPQDPRVQRKAIELYQLPDDVSDFTLHAKVQYKEIERMKQNPQQIMPILFVQNDDDHIQVLISYMNSDEFEEIPPASQQVIHQHLLLHIQNKMKAEQAIAAMQAAVQQVPGAQQQQNGQRKGPQQQQGQPQGQQKQPNNATHITYSPHYNNGGSQNGPRQRYQRRPSPAVRKRRAKKGAMAKPRVSQPSSGNQYKRRRH